MKKSIFLLSFLLCIFCASWIVFLGSTVYVQDAREPWGRIGLIPPILMFLSLSQLAGYQFIEILLSRKNIIRCFFAQLIFEITLAVYLSFYTVGPYAVLEQQGKLFYEGQSFVLSPFSNWHSFSVYHASDSEKMEIPLPYSRTTMHVIVEVQRDFRMGEFNEACNLSDLPNITNSLLAVASGYSRSDPANMMKSLLNSEYYIVGKIPATWKVKAIKLTDAK